MQTYSISYEKEFAQKSLNVCKAVQEIVRIGSSFIVSWGFLRFRPRSQGQNPMNASRQSSLMHQVPSEAKSKHTDGLMLK